MSDEVKGSKHDLKMIKALARETGLTEPETRHIVSMVGMDRASIIREARILKTGKPEDPTGASPK